MTRWSAVRNASAARVSGASLAVFRVAIGSIAAFMALRWLAYGWVDSLLIDPELHFTYPGFGWVRPLPRLAMYALMAGIALAGLAVAAGYRTRIAAAAVALGMAYIQLIDQTLYVNHYYWMILTAGLLVFAPAHRTWSLDARRRPQPGDGTVARGWVWLFRAQVGMVYVFAGLAKLGTDWLIHAQPLATWLPARADLPAIGPLLVMPGTALVMAWAGALFDLTIVGWLLWRRSRPFAYATVVLFHLATWRLFPSIGAFPWPMIAGATLFFDPAWPQRWRSGRSWAAFDAPAVPPPPPRFRSRLGAVALVGYLVVMVAMPLRHTVTDGDLLWAGAGYRFGWRVMLTEKVGTVDFVVTDPTDGTTWVEPPPPELTRRQQAVMAVDPALIRHTAQFVAVRHRTDRGVAVEVRAASYVSLNGRPHAPFVDPDVDLIALDPRAPLTTWLTPPP